MKQAFSFRLAHLLKGSSRTLLTTTLLAMMLVFTAFAATPAAHAASVSTAQTTHCAMVLAPLQPGEQTSQVVFSQCIQGNQPLVVPNASTPLVTVYLADGFTGSRTTIFGNAGPCDASGYHIDTVPSGISSYKVFNNCDFTRDYSGNGETGDCAGTFVGDVFSLAGTGMDNRMNSMRLSSVFHSC